MPLLLSRRITDFGTIEVEDLGATTLAISRHDVQKHRVTWTPPLGVSSNLPPAFSLSFDCFFGENGVRRFVPACGSRLFIDYAFIAGLAILGRIRDLDSEARQSYRAMWLVFGLVRLMREHKRRAFHTARDLYVRVTGRSEKGKRSCLPEDVGLDSNGQGRPWSIQYLLERGRHSASEAGIANPTSAIAIPYGFLEAAKLNPLEVGLDQVPSLIRMALFQINSAQAAPTTSFLDMTTERLLSAVHRHLEGTADDFNVWFAGPKSSLLKLLSAKADEMGNPVSREDIRQAVLILGWESYKYVSACIHAAMRWVENSLELTADEQTLFEHAFLPQPYYGGLPLVLLAERGDFLKPAILRIWEYPDDLGLVRVLHRILHYYGCMAEERREVDRRFKVKRASPTARSLLGQDVELVGDLPAMPAAATSFGDIADKVRESYGLSCGCGWGEYEAYIRLEPIDNGENGVEFFYRCHCGSELGPVILTPAEVASFASELGR